jgi:outer membrane protein assembly factor BamB
VSVGTPLESRLAGPTGRMLVLVLVVVFLLHVSCDRAQQPAATSDTAPTQPVLTTQPRSAPGAVTFSESADGRAGPDFARFIALRTIPTTLRFSCRPAIRDDLVVAGSADGRVCAFPLSGGSISWERPLDAPVDDLVALSDGFLVASRHSVMLLSASDGAVIGAVELPAPVGTLMNVTRSTLYVGTAIGIAAIDLEEFVLKWSTDQAGSWLIGWLSIAEGVVYAVEEDGALIAVEASDGNEVFGVSLPGHGVAGPLIRDNRVIVATIDGWVALSRTDGSFIASAANDGPVLTGPVASNSVVALVTADGVLTGYAIDSGAELWSVSVGHLSAGVPVVAPDAVILAGVNGTVFSVDIRNGDPIASTRLPERPITPAVIYSDELWMGLADGTLVAIVMGEPADDPLFTSEGIWSLPTAGSFRLGDRAVVLQIEATESGLAEWRVSSRPDEELILSVSTSDGEVLATNMGKVTLADTVRVPLEAGETYLLHIERIEPEGETRLSVVESLIE